MLPGGPIPRCWCRRTTSLILAESEPVLWHLPFPMSPKLYPSRTAYGQPVHRFSRSRLIRLLFLSLDFVVFFVTSRQFDVNGHDVHPCYRWSSVPTVVGHARRSACRSLSAFSYSPFNFSARGTSQHRQQKTSLMHCS